MPEAAFCSYHPLMTKSEYLAELLKWFQCVFFSSLFKSMFGKKMLTMKYDTNSLKKTKPPQCTM